MHEDDISKDLLQNNPLVMEVLELEEVASDCIEIEEVTSDMLLLEPLRDHNYINSSQVEEHNSANTPQTTKSKTRNRIRKLPKITQLLALYNCKLCGYSTMKKDIIEKHKESHRNIKRTTESYNTCDSNRNTLDNRNKCPKCSYTSKSMSSLKAHMHIHNTGTPYKCQECGYIGKDLKDLINHYKTTTIRESCDLCTYSSHLKDQFLTHQRRCRAKLLRAVVRSTVVITIM